MGCRVPVCCIIKQHVSDGWSIHQKHFLLPALDGLLWNRGFLRLGRGSMLPFNIRSVNLKLLLNCSNSILLSCLHFFRPNGLERIAFH